MTGPDPNRRHSEDSAGRDAGESPSRVIVLGGSAGATEVIASILGDFESSCPAAFLLVRHVHADSVNVFPVLLQRATDLRVVSATDDGALERGTVYVAPPDHHLYVERGRIRLGRGPKENRSRPSIDVLFRSAAVTYGAAAIGVIVSGMLDDGAAGLAALKQCGGVTIVQDPDEAEYPQMPLNAIAATEPAHVVSSRLIPAVLRQTLAAPFPSSQPIPNDLAAETSLASTPVKGEAITRWLGPPADFSCPDCGGLLHRVKDTGVLRYRCLVGHAYSPLALVEGQREAAERALWAAVRILDERGRTLDRMAEDSDLKKLVLVANSYRESSTELREHAQVLREILLKVAHGKPDPTEG